MKKIIVTCLLTVVLVSSFGFYAFATPKDDIVSAAKSAMPSVAIPYYVAPLENALKQIDVSESQSEQVIAIIDEVKATVNADRGIKFENYAEDEQKYVVSKMLEVCDILDVTCKIEVDNSNLIKANNYIFLFYDKNGTKFAEFDGDALKKTGTENSPEWSLIFGAAVLAVLSFGAIVYNKKVLLNK